MTASTIGHRTRCSLEAPARARRIVVAPKKWFKDSQKDTRDLLPDEWLTV